MNRKQRRAGKKGIREKKAVATAPGTGMDQGLATAIDHHQNGRLAEAEAGYRQILEATPNHADANHLLGVIAYQVGNFDVAEQLISQAVKTDPNQALYHLNLGNVLQDQQRHGDAINSY